MNLEELEKVKEKALEDHIPIIMDDTLEVIKNILKDIKPKRILEVGCAVGYSSSRFAEFTDEDCIIDTIEIDEERAKVAIQNIRNIGLENRINIYIGDGVDIIPRLNFKYDMVFIDAAKSKYSIFLEESLKHMEKGGVILADNVLYKGYVMSDYNKHKQRTAVRHLREYIKEITENPNFKTEILEVGDGLAISTILA
jgi:predicted O-methyltransferase YrrM